MTTPISIVIVNWNGLRLLERCLAYLVPTVSADDQIVVVDNGSHDGSVQWITTTYPQVEVVALPRI